MNGYLRQNITIQEANVELGEIKIIMNIEAYVSTQALFSVRPMSRGMNLNGT